MKVTHYQQMMAYLTRPGYDKGGKVLPKKKPQEEIKRRSRINYKKLKKYLDPESQMFIEKELGFAEGGGVNPLQLKQRFMQLVSSIQDAEPEEIPGIVAEAKQIKDQIDSLNQDLAPERQIKLTAEGLQFDNPLVDAVNIQRLVEPIQPVKKSIASLTEENPVLANVFKRSIEGLEDSEEKQAFMKASMKMNAGETFDKIKNIFKSEEPDLYPEIKTEDEFAEGGSVETPKRGLVDEPGSYAGLEFTTNPKRVGKDGGYRAVGQRGGKNFDEVFSVKKYGSKTKAKEAANKALEKWKKDNPIDPSKYKPLGPKPGTVIPQQIKQSKKQARELISARKKIDVWTESWVNNNIGKYKVKEYSKFEKDLKKAWKIESKKPMYNVGGTSKLLKKEGLPPVNASTQTTTINKKDVIVDNKNAFKPFGLNARVRQAKNPSSFFKKYFYAAQIEKNPNLRLDIIQYMDDTLVNKGRHAGVSQATVNAIYKRMGSNPDVVFLMSPGVLDTQNKNELFNKYFPKYNEYMEKVLIKGRNYIKNIATLSKLTGRDIFKEMRKEHAVLKKIFDVEKLPPELQYHIDHLYGVSDVKTFPKDKKAAMAIADNIIGSTYEANTSAGFGGYSVKRKSLLQKIRNGEDVTKSLSRLNELTRETYPQFKLKQPYRIKDGQVIFAEKFKGTPTQAGRFEEYFKNIYKTKEGKREIIRQKGSLKNLLASVVEKLPSEPKGRICRKLGAKKLGGISQDCAVALRQNPTQTAEIVFDETKNLKTKAGVKAAGLARNLIKLGIVSEAGYLAGEAAIGNIFSGRPFTESLQSTFFMPGRADAARERRAGLTTREQMISDAIGLQGKIASLEFAIENAQIQGNEDFLPGLEKELRETKAELESPLDPTDRLQGTTLEDLTSPYDPTNISRQRKLDNIRDADTAKSPASQMTLRDVEQGIPNIADYGEIDPGVSRKVFEPRKTLPADDDFFEKYMREQLLPSEGIFLSEKEFSVDPMDPTDKLKSETIYDVFKKEMTPMDEFLMKGSDPRFAEQIYGTQGKFAGGGIAKLAGVDSGPAPKSGPTPQGLDFLMKRGR